VKCLRLTLGQLKAWFSDASSASLYHFKSRFRPDFQPRYVAIYPRITWRTIIDFLAASGIL